jgi:hypothetical protein
MTVIKAQVARFPGRKRYRKENKKMPITRGIKDTLSVLQVFQISRLRLLPEDLLAYVD